MKTYSKKLILPFIFVLMGSIHLSAQQKVWGGFIVDTPPAWNMEMMQDDDNDYYSLTTGTLPDGVVSIISTPVYDITDLDTWLKDNGLSKGLIDGKTIAVTSGGKEGSVGDYDSFDYNIESTDKKYSGKIQFVEYGSRRFTITYCGTDSFNKSADLQSMLNSFNVDESWFSEEDIAEEVVEIDTHNYQLAANGTHRIFNEQGVRFEFPTDWDVQQCLFDRLTEANILAIQRVQSPDTDSLYFAFSVSPEALIEESNIIPALESKDYYTPYKFLSKTDSVFCSMPCRQYLIGVKEEGDAGKTRHKIIAFNNDNLFYVVSIGGYREGNATDPEITYILNSFVIDPSWTPPVEEVQEVIESSGQ